MEGWIDGEDATLLFEVPADTKTCPQCGQELFADMSVCYGCLHDFGGEVGQLPTEDLVVEAEDAVDEAIPEPLLVLRITSESLDVNVPLPRDGMVVGRSPECDVVLHNRSVSRRHVRIEPDGEGAMAVDLSARNPATLHGQAVGEGAHMGLGDELNVCGTLLVLCS